VAEQGARTNCLAGEAGDFRSAKMRIEFDWDEPGTTFLREYSE
jgi:hypothetical protein